VSEICNLELTGSALAKILSNAYKFIDSEGCVEIYVDDVPCLLPPEGCEDVSLSWSDLRCS